MKVTGAALLREALQALRTGRWKSASAVAVILLCTVGSIAVELSSISALRRAEDLWLASGGRLLVASSDAGITARSCEQLHRLGGVAAAVSVERSPELVESTGAPGEPFGVARAGRSALAFFDLPQATGQQLLLSPRVSEFVPGPHVVLRSPEFTATADTTGAALDGLSGQPHPVITSVPLAQLGPEFERSALVIDERQAARELCVVRARPGWVGDLEPVIASQLEPVGGGQLSVNRAVTQGRLARDFEAEFAARASWSIPWVAAVIVGLFAIGTHWTNRNENAVYAIVGLTTFQVRWLRLAQWLLTWAVAGLLTLIAWWALWRFGFGAPAWGIFVGLRATLCIATGSTLLFVAGLSLFRTDLVTALKDS